jgi:hypothetical protein
VEHHFGIERELIAITKALEITCSYKGFLKPSRVGLRDGC